MTDTLQAIGQALSNDVRTLTTISHNVANISTPGYRGVRTVPQFDAAAGLSEVTVLRDGGLAQTARPMDLALQGSGFFTVERDGQVLLVRAGAFRVDRDGWLVTAAGDRVLGTSGPIAMPAGDVRVDADGALRQGTQALGQLQLVTVADAAQLRPAGAGAFAFDGALVPAQAQVVQGALERSNVEPADEMLRLMETTRHAESVQRAMSMYDKAMDVGINKLGEN
ncbi:flagellar hook-basal body protein [Lysobacter korlensis]|uniref:Flagellar hook-basal body protein n=1 Tax=Lysobacter korlensis TaxID=553636 RepID=A0ABV6RLW3_9GAMM